MQVIFWSSDGERERGARTTHDLDFPFPTSHVHFATRHLIIARKMPSWNVFHRLYERLKNCLSVGLCITDHSSISPSTCQRMKFVNTLSKRCSLFS